MSTDWFAATLTKHNPNLKYFREFFNPINNRKYQDTLGLAFGSEMVSNHKNITSPEPPLEEVFQKTWMKEKYNFTKENYLPFRAKFFSNKFQCFILLRKTELVFPPSRLEVIVWYDAIYNALIYHKRHLEDEIISLIEFAEKRADTTNEKVVAACEICSRKLAGDAKLLGIPSLDYDHLMSGTDLEKYVANLPGVVNPRDFASSICQSRVPKINTFSEMKASELLRELRSL